MAAIDNGLIQLAQEIVYLEGKSKQLDFGQGSDYQAELNLSWNGKTFEAYLIAYSNPHTSYGGYYDPPETTWQEEEDEFEAVKIKDVSDWLKRDWDFDLVPQRQPERKG